MLIHVHEAVAEVAEKIVDVYPGRMKRPTSRDRVLLNI